MIDSRLLQESNLAARQPQGATSVIQAITGEGLAQGPYVAARGGVEPTTFRTVIVIVISKLLKRYSKAQGTSLFTSAATNQREFPKGGQEKLRSNFQSTRRGQSSC